MALERACKTVLHQLFHFDPWHLSTRLQRRYPEDIVRHLNARPEAGRRSALEIGCGLGDILRSLRFSARTGYDSDPRVLKAARVLSRIACSGRISFRPFTFPDTPLRERYDVILLVNWIHEVPSETLTRELHRYLRDHLTAGGELIIDTVQSRDYRFNHSIAALTAGLNCAVKKIGDYKSGRAVFAISAPS